MTSMEKDTRFRTQIVKHTYMASVEPHYNELGLSRGLNDVLKLPAMERYDTHQVEAIRFIIYKIIEYVSEECNVMLSQMKRGKYLLHQFAYSIMVLYFMSLCVVMNLSHNVKGG
jgi:hypothetical protein